MNENNRKPDDEAALHLPPLEEDHLDDGEEAPPGLARPASAGGERGQRLRQILKKVKEEGRESLDEEERKLLRRFIIMRRLRNRGQESEAGDGGNGGGLPEQLKERIRQRMIEKRGKEGNAGISPEQREKLRRFLAQRRRRNQE